MKTVKADKKKYHILTIVKEFMLILISFIALAFSEKQRYIVASFKAPLSTLRIPLNILHLELLDSNFETPDLPLSG